MTKIHYINAHCGSGKTEAAIRHVLKKVRSGERYVILQPTIPLIQQTEKPLRHQLEDSDIVAIYSEDGKESVTKRLHEFLTNLVCPLKSGPP
jgi:late competence protein required for DNA uptake (superfamily II DNA/RNA helicase)